MAKQNKKADSQEDIDLARKQWLQFKRGFDNGHSKFLQDAKMFDAFYEGEQWAEEDVAKLAQAKRPALTINMVLPIINTVLGEQSMSRVDFVYKARRPGFQESAEALTQVAAQVQDHNKFEWVESDVFQDGLITGRGYYDIRLNFERDLRGEIKIEARDPREVVLDVDAKQYDPSTWKQVFIYSWATLDDIEQSYGKEKRAALEMVASAGSHFGRDSLEIGLDTDNTFGDRNAIVDDSGSHDGDNAVVKSVRIVERQHKRMAPTTFFVDNKTGDMSPVPEGWGDEEKMAFQQRFGLDVITRISQRIRWTVTADNVVLYDDWSLYDDFTIVPYFAYFRRGRPFGMVKNLISPQEMLNKSSSQELHVVNTTANSGWTVEDGTLVNMDEHELSERGAETGLVLIHARGSNAPAKIQPNSVPSGLDRIGLQASSNLRAISGVNDGMLGETSASVSGVALQQKQARGAVQIQVPMDNLAKTRVMVAKRVLALIQKYYVEERVVRVVNDMLPDDVEGADKEVVVNEMNDDGTISRDLTAGEYDVVISTQPRRDTYNDTQFAEAVQLRELGVQIPDHVIVEFSNLARKRELIELLKQMNGFAEPSEEEAQMQQLQQEMQMRGAELELGKLEAELGELQARANVQAAKAESFSTNDEIRAAELQAKIQIKREELQTRVQLAHLTQQSRNKDVGSRMMMEHARLTTQRDIAQNSPPKKEK